LYLLPHTLWWNDNHGTLIGLHHRAFAVITVDVSVDVSYD